MAVTLHIASDCEGFSFTHVNQKDLRGMLCKPGQMCMTCDVPRCAVIIVLRVHCSSTAHLATVCGRACELKGSRDFADGIKTFVGFGSSNNDWNGKVHNLYLCVFS